MSKIKSYKKLWKNYSRIARPRTIGKLQKVMVEEQD